VRDAALSQDGTRLLVGRANGRLELWDVAAKRLLASRTIASSLTQIEFGAVATQALTATGDSVVALDFRTGKPAALVRAPAPISEFWAVDGGRRVVVVFDHKAQLWSVDGSGPRGPPLSLPDQFLYHRAISSDGRLLVAGDSARQEALVIDLEQGRSRAIASAGGESDGQGTLLAVFSHAGDQLLITTPRRTQLFDLATRRRIATLSGHHDSVLSAAFSRDDAWVATGSEDGTVRLWSRKDRFARPAVGSSRALCGLVPTPTG
jgi:WD40 repeat protein